jgi:hypothetical protein
MKATKMQQIFRQNIAQIGTTIKNYHTVFLELALFFSE